MTTSYILEQQEELKKSRVSDACRKEKSSAVGGRGKA